MNINKEWVDNTLKSMSLEEKIGQTMMCSFWDMSENAMPQIIENFRKYHLGGLFHAYDFQEPLSKSIKMLQESVKIPLLVGCDYEVGAGWMVYDGQKFPRPMARGYAGDAETEYEIGKITAQQARAMGVNFTFSPLLDLNTNPQNPDVNIRAFGEDVETINRLAIPYIKGVQENGMLATAKHFPGNGSTSMDQHISTALIDLSKEEIDKWLEPYRQAFKEADVSAVMVAHLEVPSLVTEVNPSTGRLVPTSVSKEILIDLLRKEMGFQGLVITDGMNMGGLSTQYKRSEAAVKALQAGCDMLLVFSPNDFQIEFDGILNAVKSGELSIKRLDDAVRNILNAKSKLGLENKDNAMPASSEVRKELFKSGRYDALCYTVAQKAITVIKNNKNVLPIRDISGKKVLVINISSPEAIVLEGQGQKAMKTIVSELLEERGAIVETVEILGGKPSWEIGNIVKRADTEFDYIFVDFMAVPSWGIGTMIPNLNAVRLFMSGILTVDKPVIITAFGDPYVMFYCPAAQTFVCTYDETAYSQEIAVKAWLGEMPVTGRTPVGLKGIFRKGAGIDIPGII